MAKRRGDRGKNSEGPREEAVGESPADHVRRADDADAFIRDPGAGGRAVAPDDLAETLAEEFLHSATSGEDTTDEVMDQVVAEEIGGPFVETSGADEFAGGTDESNPEDATPEALPRAVGGLARPADEEE